MKLSAREVLELVEMAKAYLPVVTELIPVITEAGKEFKPMADDLSVFRVEATAKMFEAYQEAGFTRGESLLLILNSKVALENALAKFGSGMK